MRRWGRVTLLVACSSVLAACAVSGGKPIPGGENLVIGAPRYNVGDEWRFTGGPYATYSRLIGIEGDYTIWEQNFDSLCQKCRYWRDANGTAVKAMDSEGKPVATAGVKLLDFPIRVGKEWRQRVDLRTGSGASYTYLNRFKVEGYEEVRVKAGSFKAFRISYYTENLSTQRWQGRSSWWYSPDVKNFVKRVAHSDWGSDWELESYTLK